MKDLLAEADGALVRVPQPRNPLTWRQDGRFLPDTQDAYTLALAWVASGDKRYAQRSADFIMAWVDGVDQTSDTCKSSGGSDCATSLLVSRAAPGFVFSADLLQGSGALSVDNEDRLKSWLARLILPAASDRTNNWGDAGIFMRVSVAAYIGDGAAFNAAVDGWRARMDLVTAQGEIPEETRRGSLGLLYTQGAISFKVGAAVIAERRGVNLWDYAGKNGGTLRRAVDTLAHYWEDPKSWPWHSGHLDIPNVDPAWELIYHRWPEPTYARIFARDRPLGGANTSAIIWTTLTHGEPVKAS
ncbi:MAG: alginate lyase family protein [Candidatus Dormibacteraeota bacterium]|nr:alginate lyase family protein [Candidatus Dormibacteraeota bacterium]